MDKALAAVGWDALQAGLVRRRGAGEAVGAGLAIFVEKSGLGPTDRVTISVDDEGMVEVVTGGASVGQGFETVMAQIAAEALGVDYRRVRVVHGHTDRIEQGVGAHASRATVMTGSATHIAASALREKTLEVAAGLMQMPVAALDLVDGRVVGRDIPGGPSMDLGEIARNRPGGTRRRGPIHHGAYELPLRGPCRRRSGRPRHRRGRDREVSHRLRHRRGRSTRC